MPKPWYLVEGPASREGGSNWDIKRARVSRGPWMPIAGTAMSPIITGNRAGQRHVLQGYPRGVRGPLDRSNTAVVLERKPGFIHERCSVPCPREVGAGLVSHRPTAEDS